MEIQVLGPGCPNCKRLAQLVEVVLREGAWTAEVRKVTDMEEILAQGVLRTPGLAIDGALKSQGRIPSRQEVRDWIEQAQA